VNGKRRSEDFKAKVVAARLAGANVVELAKKHGIRTSQVYKWVAAASKKQAPAKNPAKNGKPPAPDSDVERLVTDLLASLRPSLVEVIGKLVDLGVERKLDEARTTVMQALRRAA
jgi:transposase-like protein